MDTWIRGGLLVTPEGSYRAEVGIRDGRIARLEATQREAAKEVVDAQGKWILPGIIDIHTHMELPVKGTVSADDFVSGTRAAACGGVTTIIDFSLHRPRASLIDCFRERRRAADGRVAVDYGLHAEIVDVTDAILGEIPILVEEGVTSVKLYLAYGQDGRMVDDGQLYAVLRQCAGTGILAMVHAENGPLADRLTGELIRQGRTDPAAHPDSRPNFVEQEAVGRAVAIARFARGFLYIVHVTTREALETLRDAHRRGDPVWAETCPQYLLLDESVYARDDGRQYIATPPLRSLDDQKALWKELAQGHLSVISSDHCPFTTNQKRAAGDRFDRVPSGLPGVETSLCLIHSRGVDGGRLDPNRMVAALSVNPAKIFGLYPQKGALQEGSDADLVIFDPEKEFTISADDLHMQTDFSPYEGISGRGAVTMTMLRGNIIARQGRYCGSAGDGIYLPRKAFDEQRCLSQVPVKGAG
jgi:dihydropyrimidinase